VKKHALAPLSLDARLTFAANQRLSGDGVFPSVSVPACPLFLAMHISGPNFTRHPTCEKTCLHTGVLDGRLYIAIVAFAVSTLGVSTTSACQVRSSIPHPHFVIFKWFFAQSYTQIPIPVRFWQVFRAYCKVIFLASFHSHYEITHSGYRRYRFMFELYYNSEIISLISPSSGRRANVCDAVRKNMHLSRGFFDRLYITIEAFVPVMIYY
jgi:hypothetical protein